MKKTIKKIIKAFVPPIFLTIVSYFRRSSYDDFKQYKDLIVKNKELKNKHKGKRCFILGTGSSIKQEDLKPLENEIVFALNSFYLHSDFQKIMSGKTEKYYMTAPIHPPLTEQEWKLWLEEMEKNMPSNTKMIFGLNTNKINIKYILDKYGVFKNYELYWYYAGIDFGDNYQFDKKDVDISSKVLGAGTVSIYALMVAMYMGFDEIYLLGMDHNYVCNKEKDWRFYTYEKYQDETLKKVTTENTTNKHDFIAAGKIFHQYELLAQNYSGKIYNLSNNSLLDIFKFKKLTDIIKKA